MRVGPAFLQTFATQVIQSAASILTGILIARSLGPTGQGGYALFAAAVAIAVIVASLGQFEGNVLTSAGQTAGGRILLARAGVHAAAILLLAVLLVPVWRDRYRGTSAEGVAILFAVVLGVEVFAQLLRGINLGQHHVLAYNLAGLLQRFCYLTLVVGVLLASQMQLTSVLVAWAIATGLSTLFSAVWLWRRSPGGSLQWSALKDGWAARLTRGLRALVTISVTLLLVRCDLWMMGPMLGLASVGQMSVAVALAEWLWYVPSILGNVLFAVVAADQGPESLQRIARASRAVVAMVLPAAALLILVGRTVVPLIYGAAYAPAGLLFVLLVPGMSAVAIHLVVDSYFAGRGFPPISIWSATGALVAKVVLNLAVIPRFGAPGAAAATTIVYTGLLVTKVIALHRETGLSLANLLRPRPSEFRETVGFAREWLRQRFGEAAG